jgi:hypothetical protein
MSFQVFISYARKDNQPLGGDGFVTFLRDRLREQLVDLGAPDLKLWLDTSNIDETDSFAPILEEQIVASSLMIVVMSPNWLTSEYCKREVERFTQRWRGEGEESVRGRFKVVRKRPNDRTTWPTILQGQEGKAFFAGDLNNPTETEIAYYWNGKMRDEDAYLSRVRELAGIIIREFRHRSESPSEPSPSPPTLPPKPAVQTVYLARPAIDMAKAYERLSRELTGRDYAVVPDRDIPTDGTAVAFVDAALAQASVCVHLLGVKAGYTPEEDVSPIVKLQLERAALRAKAAPKALRRIIWAPKILDRDTPDAAPTAEREPVDVLKLFGERLDGDKVDGQVLSKFVEFLAQNLSVSDPPPPVDATDGAGGLPTVYLCHEAADVEFALRVAGLLSEKQVEPLIKLFDGPPEEVEALHHRRLKECDAVAVCWSQSPTTKIAMQTNEWKNWRQLQRERQFVYRALVKGPPLDARKAQSQFSIPRDEIDLEIVFDDKPDLAKLVPPNGGPRP